MSELLIQMEESTARQLHKLAAAQGVSVEQEATRLLDAAVKRAELVHTFLSETDTFASTLPPQTTDSAGLIREDRDSR